LKIIGFGHSHIVALANGAYALQAEGHRFQDNEISGQFHYLYGADFEPCFVEVDGRPRLNQRISEILAADDYDLVVACLGGNEHNALSIVQVDPKYDFVPARDPQASVDPDAQFIPEGVIRETLRGTMTQSVTTLSLIKATTQRPVVAVAPPPPLPRQRVLECPKEFLGFFDLRNLSEDRIRRKMWLSQLSLMEEICREWQITFVEPPREALDPNGMLAPEFWGKDASHGNDAYGKRMICHILSHIASPVAVGA
jgi:hypothetical protein